ncbi:MAG: hypothetical protein P9L99_21070, partial [Candidatus Lernaella stagnicola]|nr:hypothetical protein [Candidatus Lernaella stagnicola]
RASYDSALPLFRAIGSRLGEANCLWSLGDLALRESDLSGARASYDSALPLFRAIGERLGEANCLQTLALIEEDSEQSIHLFRGALEIQRDISNQLGELAALGYLARRLFQDRSFPEALKATEQSLAIACRINEVFGASIVLGTQTDILQTVNEEEAAVAAAVLRDVAEITSHAPDWQDAEQRIASLREQVGADHWEAHLAACEKVRAAAVARLTAGVPDF